VENLRCWLERGAKPCGEAIVERLNGEVRCFDCFDCFDCFVEKLLRMVRRDGVENDVWERVGVETVLACFFDGFFDFVGCLRACLSLSGFWVCFCILGSIMKCRWSWCCLYRYKRVFVIHFET